MTSTVEEKSSRVVEVLLAAVSPLELMWGKLLGQLGVGLVMLAVYVALGVLALLQFALVGLVDPLLIVYLLVFFLMAYLVFGALMLAIGAAVNQIADAQSLMGPVMILMIVPYILTPFIGRAAGLALRGGRELHSAGECLRDAGAAGFKFSAAGVAGAAVDAGAGPRRRPAIAVWFAAKVFRIGLLMHGKPPSFGTLIKWARMSY